MARHQQRINKTRRSHPTNRLYCCMALTHSSGVRWCLVVWLEVASPPLDTADLHGVKDDEVMSSV